MTVARRAHQLSGLLNTLDRGNLRQLETKNIWPAEPQKSITDWNVKSQGANKIHWRFSQALQNVNQVLIIQATFGLSL